MDDGEAVALGYALHEFCCHMCGVSIEHYVPVPPGNVQPNAEITEDMSERLAVFHEEHGSCVPDTLSGRFARFAWIHFVVHEHYDLFCPLDRSAPALPVDLRPEDMRAHSIT